MGLQAGQDIILAQITGVDQQQPQLFIGHLGGALFQQPVLALRYLSRLVKNRRQPAILLPELGIGQLTLAECDARCFPRALDDQQASFLSQVDQIQQLCNCEIAQISFERHK